MDNGRVRADRYNAEMEQLLCTDELSGNYARAFVGAFAVTGAAVSTLGELLGAETVSASDNLAARMDELQFDLGEGPCWDALRFSMPVLEPDLRDKPVYSWPAFSEAILRYEVGALFAFPLEVGPLKIGAVDMYSRTSTVFDQEQSRRAEAMAGLVARRILEGVIRRSSVEYATESDNSFSRRIVHQATGMVLAPSRNCRKAEFRYVTIRRSAGSSATTPWLGHQGRR